MGFCKKVITDVIQEPLIRGNQDTSKSNSNIKKDYNIYKCPYTNKKVGRYYKTYVITFL